jgi:hypothetical protein
MTGKNNPLNGSIIANNTFVNSNYQTNVFIQNTNAPGGLFANNIILQEGELPCIVLPANKAVNFSNNLYNKSFDKNAAGQGDIIGVPELLRKGSTLAGELRVDYFRLTKGSPGIGKGLPLKMVKVDCEGNLRNKIPDIGACEFIPGNSEN